MKKLLLSLLIITYSVLSSSTFHAYGMGVFMNDLNEWMEMGIHSENYHNCCPDNNHNSENNFCEKVRESVVLSSQKIIKVLQNINIKPFFKNVDISLHGKYFLVINLKLPPPNRQQKIKNYSYSNLVGIVKNII